jgi:ribosome-associated protein
MTSALETAAETSARVRVAVDSALDRKAQDLKVLHLGPVSDFTEYFLICSGTSQRQVQAISDAILETLKKKEGVRPLHVEGQQGGNWVLLDYGDVVVHVFQPEPRAFYGLERLWADAPDETGKFADRPTD